MKKIITSFYQWCIDNSRVDIIEEWDSSNSPMDKVSYGSNSIKYKFNCKKCNHQYLMTPNGRTGHNKSNCPICANKQIIVGYNDLTATNPDVADRWDYSRNEKPPTEYTAGSNERVYFLCKKDARHYFMTRIIHMVRDNINCPVCANQTIIVGINDLFTTNPELKDEWDFELNKDINPANYTYGKNLKVWWKCSKGHPSWQATIASRAGSQKTGCPVCSKEKAWPHHNDIATLYPEILSRWDFEKNNVDVYTVLPNSNKKYHWTCEKKHYFETTANRIIKGKGCPICANKKIIVGYNDLGTSHPELISDWHPTKNDLMPQQVTYGSDLKVWWKCSKGHEWQAVISSRARGNGCPVCAKERQISLAEYTIFYYVKKVFTDAEANVHFDWLGKREMDIFIPSLKLGIEYDGANWHKSISKDLKKDELCFNNGIVLMRIRELGCPKYDGPSIVIPVEQTKANIDYLGDTIKKIFRAIDNRYGTYTNCEVDTIRDYDLILQNFLVRIKDDSLLIKYPNIAKEWDYERNGTLTPDMVSWGTQKKVHWICEKGHKWTACVLSRSKGQGCPYCSGKRVLEGYNDLATLNPDLAKQWNFDKNELLPSQVALKSNKKVWWVCEKGHEWTAVICSRTKLGCPICSNHRIIKGYNDLFTTNPELANEWDYKTNEGINPEMLGSGSELKVSWICPKGHKYSTSIYSRARIKTGCPKCYWLRRHGVHPEQISIDDLNI